MFFPNEPAGNEDRADARNEPAGNEGRRDSPNEPAGNEDPADARTANLLGALGLEAATVPPAGRGATMSALVTIAAHPNRTVEELREPLGLSQPGAARLVQRLVDAGLVERGGPGGRGGLRLRPTEAGLRAVDAFAAARRAALLELLEPLDAAERDQLASMLERMLAARTTDVTGAKRLCRLCERRVCARCPVARAA